MHLAPTSLAPEDDAAMLRPDLVPLETYLADALGLDPASFLARHSTPMLVVPSPGPEALRALRDREPGGTVERPVPPAGSQEILCLPVRSRLGPTSNRVSLGRSPEADVVLLDESVSRFHAELVWGADPDRATLRDLGARNGTAVDGVPLGAGGKAEVESGATVCLGSMLLRYHAPASFLAWLTVGAPRSGALGRPW
jgi:hypothetical protein